MIVGKKVFLCGKIFFKNINGRIYFGFYLSFLTCLYIGNHDLFPLNHQEISFRGSVWGLVLALYQLLFIDKFVISNRK